MSGTESESWALAIDFGTSFSSAAVASGGRVELVDLWGRRRIPSSVWLDEHGALLVGPNASAQAGAALERLERHPKTQVGRAPTTLMGTTPVAVVDIVAALVSAFVVESRRRRDGTEPRAVVFTHPVLWGPERRRVLVEAAAAAGIDRDHVHLIEEPVAAASALRSQRIRAGDLVAVYDLGGGTFDAAVLRATESGFVVAGPPGGDDAIGGETFDDRLLAYVGELVSAVDPEGWRALCTSDERRWRRAYAQLSESVPRLKEALSVTTQAAVEVPALDRDVVVTRAEFERLIAGDVERTLTQLETVIAAAGASREQLAAVYPVGGSSRIPLVANRLLERYGERVVTWDDPQSAVTLGAAEFALDGLRSGVERGSPGSEAQPDPERRTRTRFSQSRRRSAAVGSALALVAAVITIALVSGARRDAGAGAGAGASGAANAAPTSTAFAAIPVGPTTGAVETVPALGVVVRQDADEHPRVEYALDPARGLRRGDVVVWVGNDRLSNRFRLGDAMIPRRVGEKVRVHIRRDGRPVALTVTLAGPARGFESILRSLIPEAAGECRQKEAEPDISLELECEPTVRGVDMLTFSQYADSEELVEDFRLMTPEGWVRGRCDSDWQVEDDIRRGGRSIGRMRCVSDSLEWTDARVNLRVRAVSFDGRRAALWQQYLQARVGKIGDGVP